MSIVIFTIWAHVSKDHPHTKATGTPTSDGSNALSRVVPDDATDCLRRATGLQCQHSRRQE